MNASLVAMEIQSMLPAGNTPRDTQGYEGFFHLYDIQGDVASATLHYIIRDHDSEKCEEKKQLAKDIAAYMNKKYGNYVEVSIKDQYRNMKEKIEPHMFLIDNLKEAITDAGVKADVVAIRGGTDGARLSYMGLPCPNMGTGGQNFHGVYEFVTVESLEKNLEILKNLLGKF